MHENQPQQGVNLRLSFIGANPHPRLEPFSRLNTRVSYFIGNDPAKWHPDIPVWGGVRYLDLYPGVDLELTGEGGRLKLRVIAQPGADLRAVRLRVEGADEVALEGERLRLTTVVGIFSLLVRAGDGTLLHPLLEKNSITFAPDTFNLLSESVDSLSDSSNNLLYSTFLGGSSDDFGLSIAVDESGTAYITGETQSFDFPTTPGAFQTTLRGTRDAFITKLNADGSGAYSTYLGGSDFDGGQGIAVDGSGAAYITGYTWSSDFPTTPGAFQTTYRGWDAFITKLNADGTQLVYSTYLGGTGDDAGNSIEVDGDGVVYVTGNTSSSDFPTTQGAFQVTSGGGWDAFVTKLDAVGSGLVYSTYLGGSDYECSYSSCTIAVDESGAAYITGETFSSDFPTTPGAFQTTCGGCPTYPDAFATKLNEAGSGLLYSTYLGGSDGDYGRGIAVDGSGAAYITGYTWSSDFPTTPGAFQPACRSCPYYTDAFISKLNVDGSRLIYSTYLGSTSSDYGRGLTLETNGVASVTGDTYSPDFPITPGAVQPIYGGGYHDTFVTKLNVDGSALIYSTFLGGGDGDRAFDIAQDAHGAVYVTGYTWSGDFPITPGAFQTSFGGFSDGFVTKFVILNDQVFLPLIMSNR